MKTICSFFTTYKNSSFFSSRLVFKGGEAQGGAEKGLDVYEEADKEKIDKVRALTNRYQQKRDSFTRELKAYVAGDSQVMDRFDAKQKAEVAKRAKVALELVDKLPKALNPALSEDAIKIHLDALQGVINRFVKPPTLQQALENLDTETTSEDLPVSSLTEEVLGANNDLPPALVEAVQGGAIPNGAVAGLNMDPAVNGKVFMDVGLTHADTVKVQGQNLAPGDFPSAQLPITEADITSAEKTPQGRVEVGGYKAPEGFELRVLTSDQYPSSAQVKIAELSDLPSSLRPKSTEVFYGDRRFVVQASGQGFRVLEVVKKSERLEAIARNFQK